MFVFGWSVVSRTGRLAGVVGHLKSYGRFVDKRVYRPFLSFILYYCMFRLWKHIVRERTDSEKLSTVHREKEYFAIVGGQG